MSIPALPAAMMAFALAFAFALAPGPAMASPNYANPVQAEALQPPPDDSELSSFVSAFVRLMGVQHGYMMLLQQEEDPTRVEELKEQAITDMEAAIEQDGMSVERYNNIALAVRDDPQLQNRVEGIIDQLAADPSALE